MNLSLGEMIQFNGESAEKLWAGVTEAAERLVADSIPQAQAASVLLGQMSADLRSIADTAIGLGTDAIRIGESEKAATWQKIVRRVGVRSFIFQSHEGGMMASL